MFIFEGFIIGLVGSLHCLGMCGPLVLALPMAHSNPTQRLFGGLLYNVGRAITYSVMGVLLGILGKGIRLSGVQQWVSILFGCLILLSLILPGIINLNSVISKVTMGFIIPLKKKMGALLQQKSIYPLFIFGLLNGLLPCGLVYMAIMGSMVSDSVMESSMYMFLFGMGTLPLMLMLLYFSDLIKSKLLVKLKKVLPVFIVVMGLLFILRGLNLGIPYLSPNMNRHNQDTHQPTCH